MYVMDRILTHSGYSVEEASSGDEAIHIAAGGQVDLILMDMQMPGRDGYSTVQALRHIPSLAHVPIIAVTANSMPGDRERTLEAGCTDYLAKPIDTRDLVRLVEHYVGGVPGGNHSDR